MNEIDAMIAGAVGGLVSAGIMTMLALGQIKWAYDQKLKALQIQISALRSSIGYGE